MRTKVHDGDTVRANCAERVFDPATGASLNLALVRERSAAVYRRYCSDRRFLEAEDAARAAQRGIWAVAGAHQRP